MHNEDVAEDHTRLIANSVSNEVGELINDLIQWTSAKAIAGARPITLAHALKVVAEIAEGDCADGEAFWSAIQRIKLDVTNSSNS